MDDNDETETETRDRKGGRTYHRAHRGATERTEEDKTRATKAKGYYRRDAENAEKR